MPAQDQLYVFIDNSFLFLQGYKHVQAVAKLPPTKHPYVDYLALRHFLQKQGELKRTVIVGSGYLGNVETSKPAAWHLEIMLPGRSDFKSGLLREKGDPVPNKKIVLCTGDKDFMTVLSDIHTSNWAFELWLWTNSYSPKFVQQVKVFGSVRVLDAEWKHFIKIGN